MAKEYDLSKSVDGQWVTIQKTSEDGMEAEALAGPAVPDLEIGDRIKIFEGGRWMIVTAATRKDEFQDLALRKDITRTKDRLAAELRKAGGMSRRNADVYEALAKRAETEEFDDYGTTHVCGPTALYQELMRHHMTKFAARVANGEFDATYEESQEWALSEEGQDAARRLTPELREAIGMPLKN